MRRSRAAALAIALGLGLALTGCEGKQSGAKRYEVVVRALDDDGEPLADLEIGSGTTIFGRTSNVGTLALRLKGREGGQVTFEPRCPEGSHPPKEAASLRLRTLAGGPPPEVEVQCKRDKRVAALLVSARGYPDFPVLVHEREVARTDATGTAHVLLEGKPTTPMRVVLDTSANPKIVPPSPHHDFQIGARDDIVVFAPELSVIKDPPKPKKRVKKEKPPPVLRPEKLR